MKKLLKFYGTYCMPCKQLNTIMKTMELPVPVEEICIEEADEEVLKKYQIRSVPTLILVNDDKLLWKHVGMISAENLLTELNDYV